MFKTGDLVRHEVFGQGDVVLVQGTTTVARFGMRVEVCLTTDLQPVDSLATILARPEWDPPLSVFARALGVAIRSVNDAWGVFTRSRITLLPHQLWVCRQVNRTRPARWLVADDVGLGKTIEAGLVLLPLIASGEIKRLLILCPASLVEQWQYRMRTMFDIRLTVYTAEADTPKTDFWNTQNQVVASMHTLRLDRSERHQRLVEADAWDMVVVDEAHHLNADIEAGPTLGYKFIEKLQEAERIRSMVFFTGTPHRGKNFGFLALLKLLRPDRFDPRQPIDTQLGYLRDVLIRNNKHEVTDLTGQRLFQEPSVQSVTYTYSEAERHFYDMLTDFIVSGKAYAKSLNETEGRAVMLVLIAMQKLASSSVAAIRRAIKGRLERTMTGRRQQLKEIEKRLRDYEELEAEGDDGANSIEEQMTTLDAQLILMNDEETRLRELLSAADAVQDETKIRKILDLLEGPFAGRNVLFFTEYKATQSLLMSHLLRRYGPECVAFINGDGRAEEIPDGKGSVKILHETREQAAERFNNGQVKFLVSTEAGGEGIDLQQRCFSLIHVDLPWNPMRLQQRVGRLNRYGQKQRVEVYSVRNPDTVEARIWDKLNNKIEHIMRAMSSVMAHPEDLLQLVLGLASPTMFRELLAEANSIPPEDLANWFDVKTARFGGSDALETVRALVGNAARFDFQQVATQIPKLDLPDLKPFFKAMLQVCKRKVADDAEGLSFHTPDGWLKSPGLQRRYENMGFDRNSQDTKKVLGIGHRLIDLALAQAKDLEGMVAAVPATVLEYPLYVYRVTDRLTSQGGVVQQVCVAVEVQGAQYRLLRDWELIKRLNHILSERDPRRFRGNAQAEIADVMQDIEHARTWLATQLSPLDLPFRVPEVTLSCLFLRSENISQSIDESDPDAD